jgi:hypothetical protein
LLRRLHGETVLAREHRLALGLFLSLLLAALVATVIAVRASALPDEASGKMLAVFDPRLDEQAMFAALVRAGGRPLRRTWLSSVWVVAGDTPGFAGSLRQAGAIGAYGELPISPELAGCFAYADARTRELFALRP